MRTTLDIDNDVLAFARARAVSEHMTIGYVISTLARTGLQAMTTPTPTDARNGLPILPNAHNARLVTLELVNQLRDETF